MDFDSYDPPQAERLLRAGADRNWLRAPRAVVTESLAAAVVVLAAVMLPLIDGRHDPLRVTNLIVVCIVFLASQEVEFPVGPIFTAPMQLAFVPMLLLLPTSLVPAVVIACRLITLLIPGREPGVSVMRLLTRIGDCAFTIGPVVVLLIADRHGFSWSDWPIYAAAMAAQLVFDFVATVVRSWFAERIPPSELLPGFGWLYLTDVCLTSVALFVDASAGDRPALVLLILPLVGLLKLFARERIQRMESSVELSSAYRGTATLLGDVLEDEDAYTGVHSREVADLACTVAVQLELGNAQLFNVEYGALLHDIGKIRVPKAILQKQGKLTPEEWKIMREHTVAGEQMLCMIGGSLSTVGRIVRHSHERYDGSGYPDGLVGEAIPIESRIVSACDAWNAMTTSRPYRRALSVEVAADEMKRCAGTQFDPFVIDVLLREVAGPPYSDGVMEAARRNMGAVPVRTF